MRELLQDILLGIINVRIDRVLENVARNCFFKIEGN